jgi:hypothetical protein
MSEEQETKLPEAAEVAEVQAKEDPSKEESPSTAPKEEVKGAEVEGGDEPTKEEEAVEAAESTATFEPVVSSSIYVAHCRG